MPYLEISESQEYWSVWKGTLKQTIFLKRVNWKHQCFVDKNIETNVFELSLFVSDLLRRLFVCEAYLLTNVSKGTWNTLLIETTK